MQTLAVASQKGGSGKSTLVTCLGRALLELGDAVTIVDADAPQHTTARWFDLARMDPRFSPLDVRRSALAVLHKLTAKQAPAGTNVRLIDCPGRLDAPVRSALVAADGLLVPLQPTYADAWALEGLAEMVRAAEQARGRALPAWVVLNRLRMATRLAKRAADLAAALPPGFRLLNARIRDLTAFQAAMGQGSTPLETEPNGGAAADIRALATELRQLLRGKHA